MEIASRIRINQGTSAEGGDTGNTKARNEVLYRNLLENFVEELCGSDSSHKEGAEALAADLESAREKAGISVTDHQKNLQKAINNFKSKMALSRI